MNSPAEASVLVDQRAAFVDLFARERSFLLVISAAFLTIGLFHQDAYVARWLGFLFAGYSAVANDSIQTIGTFIASNKHQRWWVLWLFIGGLFVLTVGASWWLHDGDVSWQRLASKGFDEAPREFAFLQVAAPVFLMVLTRLRMPVSTTFLLLSSFTTSSSGISSMLKKSVSGYALSFAVAFVVWVALSKVFARWFVGEAHPAWRVAQWVTSGLLWVVWVMQDAANIAVYLPRQLSLAEVTVVSGVVFLGLGLLFYMGGERIQQVVDEKSSVVDVRPATVITLVYAMVLVYFTWVNNVPMSTTWVFIGLLGGRELAMALRDAGDRTWRGAVATLGKDLGLAVAGLALSIVLAASANDAVRAGLIAMIGG